ncbi:thioredoxin family protein [Candidatus Poribacteria bacterium]|nr:thioredoxin family protein [Candidatus Poribacteria bacterium]
MRRWVVVAVITIFLAVVSLLAQSPSAHPADEGIRTVDVTYRFIIRDIPDGAQRVVAWIPLPLTDSRQNLESFRVENGRPYAVVSEPEYGDQFIQFDLSREVSERPGEITASAVFHVQRKAYRELGMEPPAPVSEVILARFLAPDRLVPVGGKIAEEARRVAGDVDEPLVRARRLYDHIVNSVKYDKSGTGWGRGDAIYVCDSRAGNCTDFHSLFIGEARSLGIPARFIMGIPLPPNASEGLIPGYHCWAEFYVHGHGWIPVDASEASKDRSKEDALFGGLDANRVAFTVGRDIHIPGTSGDSLNYVIYPYVEVDGKPYAKVETQFSFRDAGVPPHDHGAMATTPPATPVAAEHEAIRGAHSAKGFWGMLTNFNAEDFVTRYGYGLAFIGVFMLGMGLTLTPCVYPIVPVTVGYFGAQAGGKWTLRLAFALVFGVGIAVSYAAVGTLAAFSGSVFGATMQNPAVLVAIAALCAAMGLNAFGAFELRLPRWLTRLANGGSRGGFIGAALMGLTMGVAAASCLGAFIVSLLAYAGQKGDPALGFALFMMLGLGLATPFVALATFSSLISKVPKSGAWLVYTKKVMGTLLFAAALYFMHTLVPERAFRPLVLLCLVTAALYFGFLEKTPTSTRRFRIARLSLGALYLGLAAWWWLPPDVESSTARIEWKPYSESALQAAQAGGRPTVIYFHADWCIVCKELERLSLPDRRVVDASRDFVMLKADLTRTDSPEALALAIRYSIWGFPTLVFIGPDGIERQHLRIEQFEPPAVILEKLIKLKGSSETVPQLAKHHGIL